MNNIKNNIANNIRRFRKQSSISQKEFGKSLGVAPNTVSEWESGKYTPDADTLVKICDLLGTTLTDIYGCDTGIQATQNKMVNGFEYEIIKKYRELGAHGKLIVNFILQKEYDLCMEQDCYEEEAEVFYLPLPYLPVSAGTGVYLDSDGSDILRVPATAKNKKANFALRVAGDSMEPEYHNNDILLVRSQPVLQPGELGIFLLNGEGYFKKLSKGKLVSLNPAYPDIVIKDDDDIRCMGKVIGSLPPEE